MKLYKIIVKDVYLVEANSPKEAESKFDDKWSSECIDVHLDHYTQSKPQKVDRHLFWKESA